MLRASHSATPQHVAEGVRGILAGVKVTALVAAPQTAVYFGVYEAAKRVVQQRGTRCLSGACCFLLGSLTCIAPRRCRDSLPVATPTAPLSTLLLVREWREGVSPALAMHVASLLGSH